LDVRFVNAGLAELCNSRAALDRRFGPTLGDRVRQLLHELAGVPTIRDIGSIWGTLEHGPGTSFRVPVSNELGIELLSDEDLDGAAVTIVAIHALG